MLERIGGFALGLLLFAALTVLEVPAAPAAQAASGVAYVQGAAFRYRHAGVVPPRAAHQTNRCR